ncbi:MAG TPA: hypothetical protein IAB62_04335 [Candidatus Coprocola pullicola]|nr:hypothetical protein [Candidatus Coprocola pullicola]
MNVIEELYERYLENREYKDTVEYTEALTEWYQFMLKEVNDKRKQIDWDLKLSVLLDTTQRQGFKNGFLC